MTFSILAFEPSTGEIGSAVASCSLAVGGTVTYSRYGVGMVNTQHLAHLAIGQRVLDAMEAGAAPQTALDEALSNRPQADYRQLIACDVRSRCGAFTGTACRGASRQLIADDCVAAGNTLVDDAVVDRMVEAYRAAPEATLGERLLRSLEAGQEAGGDYRGRQAAAVRVVPPPGSSTAINLDLRVDDHREPLRELRRLFRLFGEGFETMP